MSPAFADLSGMDIFGLALEAGLACAYLAAAARPSPRGRRWPTARTVCFVAGLVLLAVALQSPLAAHDEVPWVHSVQHLMIMMAAPPLLVLGAPLTLLLRTVSPHARREIVAVLRDPAMKSVSGRAGSIGLTVEYYATMFIVMLTPLYKLSLEHRAVHVAVHAYLLTCGLLFWMPLVGRDPAGWRPSSQAKTAMVALGLPANLALAILVGARGEPLGGIGTLGATHAAAWAIGAGGIALTLAGLVPLWLSGRGREPARASAGIPAVYLQPPGR
jgi:cytochrome c oxidase assembly factor CtaG